MIDIAKIKAPPPPDFGSDLVGRIASYMYANKRNAMTDSSFLSLMRENNKAIKSARKKTQNAWGKAVAAILNDPNLIGKLEKKDLLAPLNDASAIICEEFKPTPDDGSPAIESHIYLAVWAADKFFPDWEKTPSRATARSLNDALQRAGFNGGDKTESIRAALIRISKFRKPEIKTYFPSWKPPKM